MQWTTICILLLAISEPLLSYAKRVVVVVPTQVKRSPAIPWRPGPMHYRKSAQGNDYRHHGGYHGRSNHYYGKRPYHRPPPFPHGGDDFDQGYESMNHVHIPYGKDISHAITFGKGYIPYDSMKGGYNFGRERYPRYNGQKYMEPDYPATSYSSTGPDYPTGHSYDAPSMEGLFPDVETALDYRERRNDGKKYYTSRSIEKDLSLKTQIDLNSLIEKDKEQQPKNTEFYKESLAQGHEMQGAIILPAGIPQATIAGNKDGIVLRDTVALEDYHHKLQELAKSWPAFLNAGVPDAGAALQQQLQQQQRYPTTGLQGSSFTGPSGWFSEFAQPKQGYAVKEEFVEPPPDFRTMPIQTSHFQGLPVTMNIAVPGLAQSVHG